MSAGVSSGDVSETVVIRVLVVALTVATAVFLAERALADTDAKS